MLLNFLLLGDIASSLMRDARRAAGLNQTQMQICCLMLANTRAKGRPTMTPQTIARRLCLPASRVVPQLIAMTSRDMGLIEAVHLNLVDPSADGRLRFYALTRKGVICTEGLARDLAVADSMLLALMFRKTGDAIYQYCAHLEPGLSSDAFESPVRLGRAIRRGLLVSKRTKQVA